MAAKSITLRAFLFVKELNLSMSPNGIFDSVKKSLESTVAEDREMQLNQEDQTRESDLLSGYEIQENNIFATMMRIAPGADDTHIGKDLMKKKSFFVEEMKRYENTGNAIYKSHYYICLNNNYLVTNLPKNTSISRVETYINWLIKSYKYSITPVIVKSPKLTLEDIKEINFKQNTYSDKNKQEEQQNIKSKWITLRDTIIDRIPELLFGETDSLPDIEWKNVISAELILKIKNKSKIKDREIQKIFGSILKPVSETDHIVIKRRNGESIKGSDILKTKQVEIEVSDKNFIVEPKLHQEMARFLDELVETKTS